MTGPRLRADGMPAHTAAPILVVDDDPKIVRLVSLYLERAGFEVIGVGDGRSALDVLAARHPALAILDVMLPGIDGLTVLDAIRRAGDTPVVMLSARGTADDRIAGLAGGADDYVAKPFSPAELVLRVTRLLERTRRGAARDAPPLRLGDLEVDEARHVATIAGRSVELTATEFRLLAAIIGAGGRVLSRAHILDLVYGAFDGEVMDRTIDVHIGRLREKLGDAPTNSRYVVTVRGVGYRAGAGVEGQHVRRPWRSIGAQVALLVLATTAVSLAIVAVGVIAVGRDTFAALMAEQGVSTAAANDMFDRSVSLVIVGALVLAGLAAVVLSVLVARRLTAPLRAVSAAARRLAGGDYSARVDVVGPAEVASLAGSFNQMAVQLEAQEQVRRDFVANASHELRTPLTNLQGYLEAMRDGVVEPDRTTFESLLEEVERLMRLSRSLDSLATGDLSRTLPGDPPELDLGAAVRAAVDLARPGIERAGLQMTLEVPSDVRACVEPDAVAQVMGNLLQNATRYTPSGGAVVVRAEPGPTYARVTVSNTGVGIPAVDLPHVFERFYRVDKSRDRASGGAGIGLAIVQRLVEASGGQVGADSEAGLTRFWFTLPVGRRDRRANA